MMICTVSSGDKSHSVGFHRASASWDFTGPGMARLCGSQHGGPGRWRGEEGWLLLGEGRKFPSLLGNVKSNTQGRDWEVMPRSLCLCFTLKKLVHKHVLAWLDLVWAWQGFASPLQQATSWMTTGATVAKLAFAKWRLLLAARLPSKVKCRIPIWPRYSDLSAMKKESNTLAHFNK